MSAAKMVADSTQGDVPEMSSTKKRKKIVQKKKVKKKKESAKRSKKKSQQEEEFDESDLDLQKAVYPISYYVKDRESLLEQMLHCVRGQSFSRALPDVLKELPLEDLKRRCMEQLEVMSKKRIRRILEGDDPASISSSGTEDETSEEEAQDLEGEEVEYVGMDTQVVDSTSYTLETADSDREEGSMGYSSQSPDQSDEEPSNIHEYLNDDDDADGSSDAYQVEGDVQSENEAEDSPGEPEEPEEGEVFDDNSSPEIVQNVSRVTVEDNEIQDKVNETGEEKVNETGEEKVNGTGESVTADFNDRKENEERDISAEKTDVEIKYDTEDIKVMNEKEGTGPSDDNVDDYNRNEDCRKDDSPGDNENDIKGNTETVNVESDIRNVKVDNTEESNLGGERDEENVDSDDHVITVEADHVIDEESANIAAEQDEEELSDEGEVPEKEEICIKTEKSEAIKAKQPRRIVKPPSQEIAPALTKNQMELLELEMRARAIKAMLKTAK